MAESAVGVSLANLLLALDLAGGDESVERRYAELLGFAPVVALPRQSPRSLEITLRSRSSAPTPDEAPPLATGMLRAELFAVTACKRLVSEEQRRRASSPPASAVPAFKEEDCRPRRAGGSLPFVPLVRAQRLWPALRHSVSDYRPAGVDVRRWVEMLARREWVEHVPRRTHRVASHRLHVVWDVADRVAPYRHDYQQLLSLLVRLHGPSGVTLSIVDGTPNNVLEQWRMDGRKAQCTRQPGERVLLLTDLGALAGTLAPLRLWQKYVRSVRAAGADIVAWVPHSSRQVRAELAREVSIYCLDPASRLRRQRGRVHTLGHGHAEHARLLELREQLLVLGACCVRMEPALLRALRTMSPETAAEPGLEGLWWSHQPVVGSSRVSRPLAVAQQAAYRQRFEELASHVQRAVLDVMQSVHAYQGCSTEMQELAIWGSHAAAEACAQVEKDLADAERWWRSLVASREFADTPDGRHFARDVLHRNWLDAVFQRQNRQWVAPLFVLGEIESVPPGLDRADIATAFVGGADVEQTYQLFQIGTTLEWLPATDTMPPKASRFGAPLTFRDMVLTDRSKGERRHLRPRGNRCVVLQLAEGHAGCTFTSASHEYRISSVQRPYWAREFGRDRFGLYADLHVNGRYGTAIQRLRYIEPGTFLMGSPDTELFRTDRESPRHAVTLTTGFWLADTACTQMLWQAVMGKRTCKFSGEQRPVDGVSWNDAMQFLQALRELLPQVEWTLPSEAQWEYACRAGTTTPFSFGSSVTSDQVNYEIKLPFGDSGKPEYRRITLPVKALPPNSWGLYQMHGNVWEWCVDEERVYAAEAVTDPLGPLQGDNRVGRGGSCYYDAGWARSACRYEMSPKSEFHWFGFRICVIPVGR